MQSEQLHVFPPLNTAVLFLVFNRPETTAAVFQAIRLAKPPRLYVAIDGPRANRAGEAEKVDKVRQIATAVDWPCEVKTLIRDSNLGCKKAVSSAIDWFFENEVEGIVLEDDCLPHPDFFGYCEQLLERYSNDDRVWAITGCNYQGGTLRGDGSYYFSRYNHVWGWASWRRAWQKRDMELSFWPAWKRSKGWKNFLADRVERKCWEKIFDQMYLAKIDTWDYPWTGSVWFHGGLTATPNVNLVSNIGFGADATHTSVLDSPFAAMPTQGINPITHPSVVKNNAEADRYVFDHNFGGRVLRFPKNIFRLPSRIVRALGRMLRINVG